MATRLCNSDSLSAHARRFGNETSNQTLNLSWYDAILVMNWMRGNVPISMGQEPVEPNKGEGSQE